MRVRNINFWYMLGADALLIVLANYFSYFFRFDGNIPQNHLEIFYNSVPWLTPLKLFCLYFFNLYRGMWRFTSVFDLINLIKASLAASILAVLAVLALYQFQGFSRGILAMDFVLTLVFLGGYRMVVRLYYAKNVAAAALFPIRRGGGRGRKRVLVIGAGSGGERLIREIQSRPRLCYEVVGFIDDNPLKINRMLHGVPVLGRLDELPEIVKHHVADEIVIAISRVHGKEMRRILDACRATRLPYTTIPGISEVLDGKISLEIRRKVRYEDLLGREPVALDEREIGGYITGKTVMVTGGAGSIGSELCRQIARFGPKALVIVDRSESGLYDTELALTARFPGVAITAVPGPVQNKWLMDRVFAQHKPSVVFHAAAYKHVPMMEYHPWEAVFNNVTGTRCVLEKCCRHGVSRCVMVSTDKAVRPISVMGASKRLGELLAQAYNCQGPARFMSVRFGNVVGSVGSVVPLFQKQIERGGPVTVTHPDVTRYFMTIPEAAGLILQAGAIGSGGEIFVLKMGTPIRIADMARDMITLSGYTPDEDIEIRYTGLRPGEKLYEELITQGEDVVETRHKDIMVLRQTDCLPLDALKGRILEMEERAEAGDGEGIRALIRQIVPEYKPAE